MFPSLEIRITILPNVQVSSPHFLCYSELLIQFMSIISELQLSTLGWVLTAQTPICLLAGERQLQNENIEGRLNVVPEYSLGWTSQQITITFNFKSNVSVSCGFKALFNELYFTKLFTQTWKLWKSCEYTIHILIKSSSALVNSRSALEKNLQFNVHCLLIRLTVQRMIWD